MASNFAKGTTVAIGDTETQIKALLRKHGAETVAIMEAPDRATVAFHMNGMAITMRLPLPMRGEDRFRYRPVFNNVVERTVIQADTAWRQACRERWRGLLLCIKAKLESVEAGIETFEVAFMPHIMMPDGDTVADKVLPEMQAQLAGKPPRPLLGGPNG